MKQIITIVMVVFVVVSLIAIVFTINQVNQEVTNLQNDIQSRSALLADGLKESVEPNFINKSDTYLQSLVEKYVDNQRVAGLAIVDNTGNIVAVSSSLPQEMAQSQQVATTAMDADKAGGDFETLNGKKMYVYAMPLHDKKLVVGALLVVQNASYIDQRVFSIWTGNALRIITQALLISLAVLLILRWIIYKPIQKLVESMQRARQTSDKTEESVFSQNPLFRPIIKEFSHMQKSLIQARLAASEEAKASLEKIDSPWTAERLKQFTKDILKNRKIIALSNLEPYIHTKIDNKISYYVPASGLITAIELLMEATGGTWIAQGSGDADRLVVDSNDHIQVPPEDPQYTLKRVWLSREETEGFLAGFSFKALYPLFHMAHTRPEFSEKDWEEYKKVNEKYAQVVLAETKHIRKPIILVQDFQFTLAPQIIKKSRPDATIGFFWHIPWVNAESFSICPWRKEILNGMLGADLIGFHTQLHCNNFIESVSRELEALIDYEQFAVTRNTHLSLIRPFPISIAFSKSNGEITEAEKEKSAAEKKELLASLGIHTQYVGFGVDRLDRIKGIVERLVGIESFFERHPEYIGQCTFIQITSPANNKSKEYQEFETRVEHIAERINTKLKSKNWKPIVFINKRHSHKEINRFYKLADFCLITSLHDGMNLVAKEFVVSRNDEKGVLILSQFAGAAKELKDALIINPYNAKEIAEAIYIALTMPLPEQTKRMKKLRTSVRNYNIYRWSAEFLKTLVSIE